MIPIPSRRPRPPASRNRNPFLLASAALLSAMCGTGVPVALSFALFARGAGARGVGLVLAAQCLPLALLLLPAGVAADRWPPRRVIVAANLLRCAVQLGLAVCLLSGSGNLGAVAALGALAGIGNALDAPARNRLLFAAIPAADRARTNGLLVAAASTGGLVGPALVGLVIAAAGPARGPAAAIALDAVGYLLGAALLSLLRSRPDADPVPPSTPSARNGLLASLREGWRAFAGRSWLPAMVSLFAVLNTLSWAPTEILGAQFFARRPGGAASWGVLLSLMSAGAVAGGLLVSRLYPRRPIRAVLLWFLAYLPLPIGLAVSAPFPLQAGSFVLAGIEIAFVNVIWETTLQRVIPPAVLSRVSSYDVFGSLCLLPLGYALVGPAAALLGASGTLWTGALLVLLPTLVLLGRPAIRDAAADPPLPAAPP